MATLRPWETPEWAALAAHAANEIAPTHLRELLQDGARCAALRAEHGGLLLDYARQRVTPATMGLLAALAEATDVKGKAAAMAAGKHLNVTEDRAVGHMALRAPRGARVVIDGVDVVPVVPAGAWGVRAGGRVREWRCV